MSFLKKCPVCKSDAAEITEFIRITLPIRFSGSGYKACCRVCGHKGKYSATRLGAIRLWNSNLHRG